MRKIYIKTEMKELPKRCVECELRESKTQICTATGEKTSYDNRQMMCPAWCPLVELKGDG